jgi:hypothetical protein
MNNTFIAGPLQGTWYSQTRQIVKQLSHLRDELYNNKDWMSLHYFLSQINDLPIQQFFIHPNITSMDLLNSLLLQR